MFPLLTPDIVTDMERFQALLEADPGDPRCAAVAGALERSADAFANWAVEADPMLRKDKQTLYAGLLAASQICQPAR
ncbi:hypothetical protein JOD97_002854 [Duganella sp. 1411]|uniref:hypothetical protein n=1 Tax=Duganella sp. 1411 TaxID=2806572 RepID=UPI001AE1975B|nr:hypothetical protein [Duganella sp. 1411]MBP1204812.1 hypothetical protein [Duganella sp. 1411]